MAVITVGGVDFPSPSDIKIGVQDINKADRNTKGTMILERITTKRKLDLSWKFMTAANLAIVLNAVSGTFFTVTYTDPVTNALRTGTFYAGDRTVGVMDIRAGVTRYEDIKFNLIER